MENATIQKIVAFIRKYKILHILFWTWNFIDLVHLQRQNGATLSSALHNCTVIKLGQMACVYFVVYYLMPKFLHKGGYLQFILLLTITIPAASVLTLVLRNIDKYITAGRLVKPAFMRLFLVTDMVELATVTAFFFAIYTIQGRFITEQRNRLLEKERLETELNFLKAQINPHFLFNTINSVYVLIDEDKKLASQTLLKFSALLRYQLYDCTHQEMPLERELEFLRDYADLETLRNGSDVQITYQADGGTNGLQIAPFILVPFVENAFKHRSHRRAGNYIHINAHVQDNKLHFSIVNTCDDEPLRIPTQYGGIGLQNVQRRLDLLYAGRYKLQTTRDNGIYNVDLQLTLNENAMHTGR